MILLDILIKVILPIFVLIGVGVLLDRTCKPDLPTLSKLNFYIFVPALSFVKLLEAQLDPGAMMTVGVFSLVHVLVLFAVAWGVFALHAFRTQQTVLTMGTIFYNAGNYGIPLVLLVFGDSMIGVITVVLVVQNFLSFTLGVWMLERHTSGPGRVLAGMAKVPVVYAVALALLLRGLQVSLPEPIMLPLRYLADGLIPIALITLGVQLARTRLSHGVSALSAVTVMRLVVSPLIAAGLVVLFRLTPPVSSVLIVAAGFPVAVNLYILAAEYRKDAELASQTIFLSTLVSAGTISLLLLLVRSMT